MTEERVLPVGLIHLYGEDGTGKSLWPFTIGTNPKKTVFLDDDSGKSRFLAGQFGCQYHDLFKEFGNIDEVEFHERVLRMMASLPDDLDLIVFDNAARFFTSAHPFVVKHFDQYRKIVRGTAAIIGAYQWRAVREQHLPRIYSMLVNKAKIVVIITHEKEETDSTGTKTGAMEPVADKSLRKAANAVIRLTKSETGNPVPTGLVIKDLTKFPPTRVLPPKIPQCNWDALLNFWNNPVGENIPDEYQPSEFERHLIEGSLSPEQKQVYEFNRRMRLLQKDEEMAKEIVRIASEYSGIPKMRNRAIVESLEEEYPDITVEDVEKILAAVED